MFTWVKKIWQSKSLRSNVLITIGMLVLYRLMAVVPVPGVDPGNLQQVLAEQQLLGLLDVFAGGTISRFSIVMLGLGPYINASIIMQILTYAFPKLKAMSREGEQGRRTINQITRWLTVPLSVVQGVGVITFLQRTSTTPVLADLSFFQYGLILATITAGTIALMWLGELITERGVANGISLIIFTGIVAGFPGIVGQAAAFYQPENLPIFLAIAGLGFLVVLFIVLLTEGQRTIPIQYAKRVRGSKIYGGQTSYLPLRVNQAGVIPIIFALSFMAFPPFVATLILNSSVNQRFIVGAARFISTTFNQQSWLYAVIYFFLIVIFCYFYTAVTFEPKQIAENIQKQGGYVPGIRPGKRTEDFLQFVVNRVLVVGSVSLGLVAVLPVIIQQLLPSFPLLIGGIGILIVVSVILETRKQIVSQILMHTYDNV